MSDWETEREKLSDSDTDTEKSAVQPIDDEADSTASLASRVTVIEQFLERQFGKHNITAVVAEDA